MQDEAYDDFDAEADGSPRWGRAKSIVSTAIGAIVAMSLLMALGIWFYRLGVRDAQNVPIIRAAVEPAKERPEDPGGLVAQHQDIQSYEVAENDSGQASAIVVAPAPEEPTADDVAMGQLTPTPRPVVPEPTEPTEPTVTPEPTVAPVVPPVNPVASDPTPEPTEIIAQAPDEVSSENDVLPVATTTEEADVAEPSVVAGGTSQAPAISPVARPRPANLRELSRQAVEREREQIDALVARAASSEIQVQLAADPDENVIRQMWQRIRGANGDLLRDRALAIGTTVSGGVTYYRLRVGPFSSTSEARSICQALKARGQDCIVARKS